MLAISVKEISTRISIQGSDDVKEQFPFPTNLPKEEKSNKKLETQYSPTVTAISHIVFCFING
jgi:hypothetical protein